MCGISGVISNYNIYNILYESLFHIQHRGQDSSGIALMGENTIEIYKTQGLLNNIDINCNNINANIGIGHVRYPTSGVINSDETQPFLLDDISLCHNGTIANYKELYKDYICKINLISESDSELLLHIFKYELLNYLKINNTSINNDVIVEVIKILSKKCKGGYSVIIMIKDYGLICFKDPHGIRPLTYSQVDNAFIISSESVSISNQSYINDINIKEVNAGEVLIFKNSNNLDIPSVKTYKYSNHISKPCIFEWIYIARDDSIIYDVSVYNSRLEMGETIANKMIKSNIDIDKIDYVVPVPDTSKPVALRLSEILKIPYREAIIKNRYIARTFIMDNQEKRQKNIKRKLSVVDNIIKNKNILIVDDSIVRGNTMKHIIELLYKCEVKSIIVASSAPIIKYQNFYGLDIPTKEELIGHNRTVEDIEKLYNVKKIIYLDIDEVCNSVSKLNSKLTDFELSVFDGKYIH